ncbi:hypothetical protein ACWDZ4_20135 [Streptomyces sp. NPDC003016]
MPRLTRRQKTQLADIDHFLRKILTDLSDDRTVVTMRSRGTTTREFYNSHTGEWLAPVRPSSLAYVDHALRRVSSMLRDAAPKEPGQ